jgi:carboxyl-terminal processing protease
MRRLFSFLSLIAGIQGFLFAQNHGTCCKKASDLLTIINHYHVQPARLDSSFSNNLFHDFFLNLDPLGHLIAATDLQFVYSHRFKLLDEIKNDNPDFLKSSTQLYKQKLEDYKTWLATYLAKPLDYSDKTFFTPTLSANTIPSTREDLMANRKQTIKYAVLDYVYKKTKMNFASHDFKLIEAEARRSILQNMNVEADKMLHPKNRLENEVYEIFLKSIAVQFDPHTAYFSNEDESEFKTSLSVEDLSFGFDLKENDNGQLSIERIFPGGAAWKSTQLNKGDIIIGIKTDDGQQTDLQFRDLAEVQVMLESFLLKKADIIVQKPDGQIKSVSLEKRKIEQATNSIQGFVLTGERKIGYVSLPDFYTQWENDNDPGCASDMAKTLVKLKQEKIEGLIIDLRYNGGGSLDEALNLAGIFIDLGALCIMKQAGQAPITLKDQNKGTIYDGPLILMVNGFSASASEILAATLQDYNRALVVGTSTFGKSTGQAIVPFTTNFTAEIEKNDLGSVKITMDKFYRVTGKSHQLKGVKPNIFLPDFSSNIPEKEGSYRNSLPPDSINKKTYYIPLRVLPVQELNKKSKVRIEQSFLFKQVQSWNSMILEPIPLQVSEFGMHQQKLKSLTESIDKTRIESSFFKAQSPNFDSSLLAVDQDRSSQNNKLLKELEGSVYINETFKILCDYITLNK